MILTGLDRWRRWPSLGSCPARRPTARRTIGQLFKAELVRNRGPWKNIDDLEIAVAEYVDWSRYAGDPGMSEKAAVEAGGSSIQEACGVRSLPGDKPSCRARRHGRLVGAQAA
jgi:hypothetical protein